MWLGMGIVGVLVIVVAGGMVWASRLPSTTSATVEVKVRAAPERIFEVMTDVGQYPTWMKGIGEMTPQPPTNGRPTFLEKRKDRSMTLVLAEAERPRRVSVQMSDSTGAYASRWTYELVPGADGTTLIRIAERAELNSPAFRVGMHLAGLDANVKSVAESLKAKLDTHS